MSLLPPHTGQALVEMRGVDVPARVQRHQVVLSGVDWTVATGDFWVIGGLAGSGKSDLLAMLACLTRPLAGECRLFGEPLEVDSELPLETRLRVGLVFAQGGCLLNQLSVAQNVALPLDYHRGGDEASVVGRVELLLETLGLSEYRERLPDGLAPLWRQRVALARSLALAPELLLVDDPLALLDPHHTRWWVSFLQSLSSGHPLLGGRPLTIVVTVDDVTPWRQIGGSFALLREGRMQVLGRCERFEEHASLFADMLTQDDELI